MTKPNLFIIGAPKCGTSSLCYYLEQHPSVIFSNPKEPNYFCQDITSDYCSAKTEEEYLSLCFPKDMDQYAIVGDGSVSSLYSETAVQNILRFNPDAKFIVMLRNPIELVYSLHRQLINADQEDVEDFIEAWRLQDQRKRGGAIPKGCLMPKALQYGDVGKLGEQIERLYRQVPKNRVMIIHFDDFERDTAKVYQSVLLFLGLPDGPEVDFRVENESKQRLSVGLHRFIKYVCMFKDKFNIQTSFGILTFIFRKNFRSFKRAALPNKFYDELAEYFRNDIEHLSELIERDCAHWIKNEQS